MSLIITIFVLVFITELSSWIGKSVLLDLVSTLYVQPNKCWRSVLSGIRTSSNNIQRFYSFSPTKAESWDIDDEEGTITNKRAGPVCKMGKVEAEHRQKDCRPWENQLRIFCMVWQSILSVESLGLLFALHWPSLADGELSSNKTAFSFKFNTVLWILTTGLQFVVGWWYRKSAVFYLPRGWFGPLTWLLALPFAPKGKSPLHISLPAGHNVWLVGSVSVGVWQMACRRVIKVGERVVKDLASKCDVWNILCLFTYLFDIRSLSSIIRTNSNHSRRWCSRQKGKDVIAHNSNIPSLRLMMHDMLGLLQTRPPRPSALVNEKTWKW